MMQMSKELISNIIVFVCAMIGFGQGIYFFREKALYLRMISFAMGCFMLGKLYIIVMLLTGGRLPEGFHLGLLGSIGGFLFFFSSKYGVIDSLVDDGSKKFIKYRVIGFVGALVLVLMEVPVLLYGGSPEKKIVSVVFTFFMMVTAYYHLKHFVIEDVDFGIVATQRKMNLVVYLTTLLSMNEIYHMNFKWDAYYLPISIVIAVLMLLIIPLAHGGAKKWTI